MKKQIFYLLIITISSTYPLVHYKGQEFWENPYWGEPFVVKDWLTNFTIKFASGSTHEGLNNCGKETNVLQVYGLTKLSNLTKGVPSSILDKYPSSPINNVWEVDNLSPEFGNISLFGKFRSTDLSFHFIQQFKHGFFIGTLIQIEDNRFTNIYFTDSTKTKDLPFTISQQEWQTFTNDLFENLDKYGICVPKKSDKKGLYNGDLFFGWAQNFSKTNYLDFIDFTGIFAASFAPNNDSKDVFDLNHNLGDPTSFIISAHAAIGLWNWVTIGTALGAQIFKKYREEVPMKTDIAQSGIIKLATGEAKIDKGPIINFNMFFKAEHFYKRFSIMLAYQHTHAKKVILCPEDLETFNYDIVNSDAILNSWVMNTINFCMDYELATEERPYLPKIGIFFDIPISGHNIFDTKQSGIGISIRAVW